MSSAVTHTIESYTGHSLPHTATELPVARESEAETFATSDSVSSVEDAARKPQVERGASPSGNRTGALSTRDGCKPEAFRLIKKRETTSQTV